MSKKPTLCTHDAMRARIDFGRHPDTGMFVGPDGCHYQDEVRAFYSGVFNLCGCGDPESVHAFLLECLRQHDGERPSGVGGIQRVIADRPEAAAEFVAHFLDRAGLTDHGGSVYGAWLTDRGRQALEVGSDRGGES